MSHHGSYMFMIENTDLRIKFLCVRHQNSECYHSKFHFDTLYKTGSLNVDLENYVAKYHVNIYENFYIRMNPDKLTISKSKIYKKLNATASEYFLHIDGYKEHALIVLDWYKHRDDRFFSHIHVYNQTYMDDMVPCSEKIKIHGRAPDWIKK